jgi:hypothetical protein
MSSHSAKGTGRDCLHLSVASHSYRAPAEPLDKGYGPAPRQISPSLAPWYTDRMPVPVDPELTKLRRMLFGLDLHTWEQWMLGSLGLAALAAVAVVVSTTAVVFLTRAAAEKAKQELDEYKLTVAGQVADAQKEGIEAGKTAGNALIRAAALEKEAQQLKAANLALEIQIQPRRLTGENSAKLSDALTKIKPLPIGIVSRLFDPEGADFADDLSNSFTAAHWQAVRQKDWTVSDKGVAIASMEGTLIPTELATALLAALDAANVKGTIRTIPETERNTTSAHFQPNALYLLVGAK